MRDYAQGAFRMRGIGKGQTVTLYLIPEVRKLIDAETRDARPANLIAAVAAWLTNLLGLLGSFQVRTRNGNPGHFV